MATPVPLLQLQPVPVLLRRLREELPADFVAGDEGPVRIGRAPGRLDVMGGIADYTGSLVCEMPLDRAAAVAVRNRGDRDLQVFSYNMLDEHKPFTLRISFDALTRASAGDLRREFNQSGRRWAAYLVGCLYVLHCRDLIDLRRQDIKGLSIALYSAVPSGVGISSSAAIEVATMSALIDHFAIPRRNADDTTESGTPNDERSVGPLQLSEMCQWAENHIAGAPCGIMDPVSSCLGQAGTLLRLLCQPHTRQPDLHLPAGVRVLGISSNVRHSVAGEGAAGARPGAGQYARTRCAAFMAHKIILDCMRRMGIAAGQQLVADPMGGYLANLDPDDYKRYFRPTLPEALKGGEFLLRFGPTIDKATSVEVDHIYSVQRAADHHVLEARRVRNFARYIEEAGAAPRGTREQGSPLDRAGHLMYASHLSYTNDAMLGSDECDLLVKLAREREPSGIYGAKITGGGAGGTVAVLADEGPRSDAAIAQILAEYRRQTGHLPEAFTGSSPGAWHTGTTIVDLRQDTPLTQC